MSRQRDPLVRCFDVTNPQKHPTASYTVYKVTSKVFPVHSPEVTTEKIVWKRYNDFNKLHKALSTLHRNLHRPGVFPDFPKPTLFGRFDAAVIEERRQAALNVLNFVGSQAHLFNSLTVQQFFSTSEIIGEKAPSDQAEVLTPQIANRPVLDPEVQGPSESNTEQLSPDSPDPSLSLPTVPSAPPETEPLELGGVWAHRHPEDSDSSSIDSELLGVPPTSSSEVPPTSTSEVPPTSSTEVLPASSFGASGLQPETPVLDCEGDLTPPKIIVDDNLAKTLVQEFDPLALDQTDGPTRSVMSNHALLSQPVPNQNTGNNSANQLSDQVQTDQSDVLTPPSDSLSEFIVSKEDYLYKAVKNLRRAARAQSQSQYQSAFDYYKDAVSILLIGVQSDSNDLRRNVIRKKTSEYLLYADRLNRVYIDGAAAGDRWREANTQIPRFIIKIRGGLVELSQYKVTGLIHDNMLVLNKTTDTSYVIKVLLKNTDIEQTRSPCIVPTTCKHMVKLARYFETDSTIYLLLQYTASGRTLWQYIQSHTSPSSTSTRISEPTNDENIYTGQKVHLPAYSPPVSPSASVSSNTISADGTHEAGSDELRRSPPSTEGCTQAYSAMVLDEHLSSSESSNISNHLSTSPRQEEATPNQLHDKPSAPSASNRGADSVVERGDSFSASNSTATRSPTDPLHLQLDEDVFNITPLTSPITEYQMTERRMSLRRSNSSVSRSASAERRNDSPRASIPSERPVLFDEGHVRVWAAEILLAINECHTQRLILRTLSPENILLDEQERIKLTYFCQWPGVSKQIPRKKFTTLYAAPEVDVPGGSCPSSDYWSFGVVLFELLTGTSLVSVHPEGISSHTNLKLPNQLSPEAKHLLKHLLRFNPRERLGAGVAGFDEVKSHPFFNNIDWSCL